MRYADDINRAIDALASELAGITADGHLFHDDGTPAPHLPREEQSMQHRRILKMRAMKRERIVGWLGVLVGPREDEP